MNSLYTTIQQIVFGVFGITTVLTPNSQIYKDTSVLPVTQRAPLEQSKTLDSEFSSKVRMLREKQKTLLLGNKEFQIILADTNELRTKGLSGSNPLGEDQAMLFLFDSPSKYGFWMKEMRYPIDIIWVNTKGKIIYIVKDAKPESFPEVFKPRDEAIVVIEIKGGLSKKVGLLEGDYIRFKDRGSLK